MGNRVDITFEPSAGDGLTRVVISDDFDTDTFQVRQDALAAARAAGPGAVVQLIADHAGCGNNILRAAVDNDTCVCMDATEDVPLEVISTVLQGSPRP